jgi:hypothetical protein
MAYHIYLISSLPMLYFGMKPPFSFEGFIERCRGLIPENEIEMLKAASGLKKWQIFDKELRNELVKLRAARKHKDPLKYLRKDGYVQPYIIHIAASAIRNKSILEAEKILDQARWQALDELSIGHYFDIDILLIYGQKLLILERWERIRSANKQELLAAALGADKQTS